MAEKVIIRKNIRKFKINKFIDEQDLIISEEPLTLFINGYQFLTLMVLQEDLEELIMGFLAAEGIIEGKNDLKKIDFKYDRTVAMIEVKGDFSPAAYKKRTLTSGCGGGSTFINLKDCAAASHISSDLKLIAAKIPLLMSNLQQNSEYFQQTGGTHIAALATDNQIIYQFEDIGRHNTLDKVIGRALKDNIQLTNKIVLTSGRISSEMVVKILKQKIPFLVSRSAPTEAALKIARARNLTLIGFCRGKRFNIYSGEERIKLD
ncbi:formate dehydrogenase accessory sulfurtransferase FdhD [Halanaerobium sp. ST460_2HS_T2]|uniref:formate dehydrogenase accessory sulfurtransferase FdhD n=1 Tax=Halanaerobium sp. ST460_2HS_T2 TaxID=2183914 RepID=UPI000DF1EFDE|nr:formate dehydrogenase accessory sulfurtransferase FdhD [Halanaerobium sp. ST460_2HS_T2]RCW54627.1 FdhD protein [Halanaerobium sp. ST460_2HS_T2]